MKWDLLVVEDDTAMAGLLAELAEKAGFTVRTAPCHATAAAMLAERPPDALFTDLRLPDGDGIDIIRRAVGALPDLPAVLITGYASVPDVAAAFRGGAMDLVTKPFETRQVEQVLARIEARLQDDRRVAGLTKKLAILEGIDDPPVAVSPQMQEVAHLARQVSTMDVPVLLTGETGTGKGVVARLVHEFGGRSGRPWFVVNCGSVSASLAESELFGHEKGAFTGAVRRKLGLLELADGGTLFLDEINSAPPEIQSRLLNFVQERSLLRVGGQQAVTVNVRLIAAANEPLQAMVEAGRFRQDLFFRLNVFPIHIPPLRERPDDILPLAQQMLTHSAQRLNRPARHLDEGCHRLLLDYPWPGNVRELENVLQRAVILCPGETILPCHLPAELTVTPDPPTGVAEIPREATLAELERYWIETVLERCQGNKTEAARRLGIDPSTLHRKLRP